MTRSRGLLAGAIAASAMLAAVPLAGAASAPSGQFRGTTKQGGKVVVDASNGKVVAVQAYVPTSCSSSGGSREILVDNLKVSTKRSSGGSYSFTVRITKGEQGNKSAATVKGTWNAANRKLTGTIAVAGSAYATCAAFSYTATKQS